MDEALKKRLIGAAVLASLAIIFLPMLLEEKSSLDGEVQMGSIPPRPSVTYKNRLQKLPEMSLKKMPPPVTVNLDETDKQAVEPKAPVAKYNPDPSGWVIQAGSFSSRDNAARLVAKLRKKGFDTFLETVEIKGKKHHRVKIGPEISHANAEKIRKKLASDFKLKARVIRYP